MVAAAPRQELPLAFVSQNNHMMTLHGASHNAQQGRRYDCRPLVISRKSTILPCSTTGPTYRTNPTAPRSGPGRARGRSQKIPATTSVPHLPVSSVRFPHPMDEHILLLPQLLPHRLHPRHIAFREETPHPPRPWTRWQQATRTPPRQMQGHQMSPCRRRRRRRRRRRGEIPRASLRRGLATRTAPLDCSPACRAHACQGLGFRV
jgi:hypothetical protein